MARILLIDDDDAVRTMLRLTLNEFGHQVTEARDGAEGLKLLRNAGTDLVITDILMPEKEGFEVMLELRATHPSLKIIAISGGGRMISAKDYLAVAKAFGASKTLAKPFSNEALLAAIGELLAAGEAPAMA
jgi:CheY-like chemotaxis protein